MSNLIVAEIEKIKSPLLKAFVFRFYNTFKTIVLPIILGVIFYELNEHKNFEGLMEEKVWLELIFTIVSTLVGSAVAGLEKVNRENRG